MTLEEFRNLAKSLVAVREINRLGNETLFVEAVAIATLGWPDPGHAMVTVWPADQTALLAEEPGVFREAPGGAGRRGATIVALRALTPELAKRVLRLANERALKVTATGGGQLKLFATRR